MCKDKWDYVTNSATKSDCLNQLSVDFRQLLLDFIEVQGTTDRSCLVTSEQNHLWVKSGTTLPVTVLALHNAWPTPAESATLSKGVPDQTDAADMKLQKSEVSDVSQVVQQTMNDTARRKHNIVITWLSELPSSDSEQIKPIDQNAFLSLCERYLDVRSAIAARLGKQKPTTEPAKKALDTSEVRI